MERIRNKNLIPGSQSILPKAANISKGPSAIDPPARWVNLSSLSLELGQDYEQVLSKAKILSKDHPEWIGLYPGKGSQVDIKNSRYCTPELADLLRENPVSPQDEPVIKDLQSHAAINETKEDDVQIKNESNKSLSPEARTPKPPGFWKSLSIAEVEEEILARGLDPTDLPSTQFLNKNEHSDLVYGLAKRFGSFNVARELLGGKTLQRSSGYWKDLSEEALIDEIKKRGLNPTELPGNLNEHQDLLEGLSQRYGSIGKAREALGGERLKTKWPESMSVDDFRKELVKRGLDPEDLPSSRVLFKSHRDLVHLAEKHIGSLAEARKLLGGSYLKRPDGYWETLSIEEFVEEIKRSGLDPKNLPSNAELRKKYPYLINVMYKRFGSPNQAREALTSMVEPQKGERETPEGWLTKWDLQEEFRATPKTIENLAESLRTTRPDWVKKESRGKGVVVEYYSPELVAAIRLKFDQLEEAPSGWVHPRALEETDGLRRSTVEKIAEQCRADHPDWFRAYKIVKKNGLAQTAEHYAPELVTLVKKEYEESGENHRPSEPSEETQRRQHAKREKNEALDREKKLVTFIGDVVEGETIEAHEFQKMMTMFGAAHAFDILYRFRPDFEKVPVEKVQGTLAKYLGDFLLVRGNFNLEDLDIAVPYLSNESMRDSLFEVVKQHCLHEYHVRKLETPGAEDRVLFEAYLAQARAKAEALGSQEILEIIGRVEGYFRSIFEDFPKPARIVDELKADRPFPDVNQTLNIKEISEKKKMLIGDEMGMGKSASAILAKETLGAKKAVVVVPNNVIDTWLGYLSDKVGEDGSQIGYFKPGGAPRVLVLDTPKALLGLRSGDHDYVLISQEKITKRYTEALKEAGFDMLIVDEVHKFKNLKNGARSRCLIELAAEIDAETEHLVLLSGTPIPNKIKDIATVLKLLYPERFANMENGDLVNSLLQGNLIDIRNLLVPRMQMKELRESISMPSLIEERDEIELSPREREIYEVLLEDDELTADQKIRAFRRFLMNPSTLETTPDVESSKITHVGAKLRRVFETKDKVVLFVNSYVEGMIRGEDTVLEKLGLPPEVTVLVIEGDVPLPERQRIQEEFRASQGKVLLAVSGMTADVGVDFSAAEHMQFYNDPWTLYEKKQQIARAYRPGLENDLTVATSVVSGTIEEGIEEYIELKYRAIQKVLKGVPITEVEKKMLRTAERQETRDVEGSPRIASEWLNSPQNRLHRFFGATKEVGEKKFMKFLRDYDEEYAECYLSMGGLGFQANTARVVGTMIDHFARETSTDPEQLRILDIASGPEMLKKHIRDEYKGSIFSMDINPSHFRGTSENRLVGSFSSIPVKTESMDCVNLSLALHYSSPPIKGDYERIRVLTEMNRVLKTGGRAVINLLYSLRFKDDSQFRELVKSLGFRVMEEYTGEVSAGPYYQSPMIVLEKEATIDTSFEDLVATLPREQLDAVKLKESGVTSLRNSRRCVSSFTINDQEMEVAFNADDRYVLDEQEAILAEGEMLKEKYGGIRGIPTQEIMDRDFLRINNGKTYRLYKKSERIGAFIDVR